MALMKTYKCDRCGKTYHITEEDHNNVKYLVKDMNSRTTLYEGDRVSNASGGILDLCPRCNLELEQFMNEKHEISLL